MYVELTAVVLIILGSGILGGSVNFLLLSKNEKEEQTAWQYVATGISSAFIVPLFLSTISSNLLADLIDQDGKNSAYSKFFILIGFTLVAALSSRSFISTISEKILQQTRDASDSANRAKEAAKKAELDASQAAENARAAAQDVEDVVSSFEEGDQNTPSAFETASAATSTPLSNEEKAVIRAMKDGPFPMRSLSGLAKQIGLAIPDIETAIKSLVTRGLLRTARSRKGFNRWYLTYAGRELTP